MASAERTFYVSILSRLGSRGGVGANSGNLSWCYQGFGWDLSAAALASRR